ncbi:MAG: hypothetical protein IIA85_01025 [Nanoarchaeota archaeon]|nr:hypothetical protein [Nanoarchaeota archaeon]
MKKGDKEGQFYLLATVIIIAMIGGFILISNFSQKRSDIGFNYLGEELNIESEKIIDYGISNNKDIKALLENFTETYSIYSEAENLYFIFGNKEIITLAGYKKSNSGSISINVGSGDQELILNKGTYNSIELINPQENIKVTVNEITYDFSLKSGENFYFIISKELEGEIYIIRN